jgi:hypothetical protein
LDNKEFDIVNAWCNREDEGHKTCSLPALQNVLYDCQYYNICTLQNYSVQKKVGALWHFTFLVESSAFPSKNTFIRTRKSFCD